MARIVAIDPDPAAREQFVAHFRREGHEVHANATGAEGLDTVRARSPELVLMDLQQTDVDGIELLRTLRRETRPKATAVFVVTARREEIDRVVAFELGADDYVLKPFSARELGLRVRAILRRQAAEVRAHPDPPDGRIRLDPLAHRVWVGKRELALSLFEFRMLNALHEERARTWSREQLLEAVWGNDRRVSVRSVDACIKRLRGKLGSARYCLETVRGFGYRLAKDDVR